MKLTSIAPYSLIKFFVRDLPLVSYVSWSLLHETTRRMFWKNRISESDADKAIHTRLLSLCRTVDYTVVATMPSRGSVYEADFDSPVLSYKIFRERSATCFVCLMVSTTRNNSQNRLEKSDKRERG